MQKSKGYYIFDRAHGENIAGKRSPDGKHREWLWSDNFCKLLLNECAKEGIRCEMYPLSNNVVVDSKGRELLSKRVDYYNSINQTNKIVFSHHNNASAKVLSNGNSDWDFANGMQVHTNMEEDFSDKIAEPIIKRFSLNNTIKIRRENNQEYDWDSPFTILSGYKNSNGIWVKPNYYSVLIEWFFMNNKLDVARLNDPIFVNQLVSTFIECIFDVERLL